MTILRSTVACLLLCGLAGLGCERGPHKVPVHGIVRYRGEPLEFGSVMFQPAGSGQMARSQIAKDGTFRLISDDGQEGIEPGRCSVRIAAFELQRQNAQGTRNEEPSLGKSAIPKKYQNFGTSGLEFDIRADMTLPLEIDLESS